MKNLRYMAGYGTFFPKSQKSGVLNVESRSQFPV